MMPKPCRECPTKATCTGEQVDVRLKINRCSASELAKAAKAKGLSESAVIEQLIDEWLDFL